MPEIKAITVVVHAHIAALKSADPTSIRDLYAPGATGKDLVRSPIHNGHDSITSFYAEIIKTGTTLHLDGPVRIVGHAAAFAWAVTLEVGGPLARVDAIDCFDFDEAGKVEAMRSYHGPSNLSLGALPHA